MDLFRSAKKGSILLKEGQKTRENIFVLKGMIRVYYVIQGEEKTTAFYAEMEGLTPACVVSNTPSDCYISCVEDCVLLVSNVDTSEEVNRRFPKFDVMCRVFSDELLAKERLDFDAFKTSTPEQRYLNLLHKRPDLVRRVPQHQLASFLGITPQSLSRMRARIVEKKG